ncbi:IclR family transcriptional regulator [Pedobacter arcticus]|uniref:IclR family transcriptional regulator n=1 Tax=Pedobacter arcticus TaxID=752140 RepID=UPI0002E72F31|nr:IclR family transcriptional regulator C-terminal domain-containing protein [Pedobacter arcticus]
MIQVIHRAFDIIEYVAEDINRPKLMGNIAQDLNLNTATCANIIKTLVNRGLLQKAENEKGYLIGNRLFEISQGTLGFKELIKKADPVLDHITETFNENCLIAILRENSRKIILNKKSNQLIQATTSDEKLACDSSTGRLLIAFLNDKEVLQYLKKYGLPKKEVWPNAASRIGFFEQIELIRKQGYALIEDTVQIIGVAVPIYKNKKVIASFSIYTPSFRFNDTTRQQMIKLALETSEKLSE